MDIFIWDGAKNELLRQMRDVCFEDAVAAIDGGRLLDILEHPDQCAYSGQKLYIIELREYAWVVPSIKMEDGIWLKTMFPSRKYTRQYLLK